MATPDAVARIKQITSWDKISETYFALHSYSWLGDFIQEQLRQTSDKGVVIQITTHTSLLQYNNLPLLQESLNFEKEQITLLTLQQFDTEEDFCNKIR